MSFFSFKKKKEEEQKPKEGKVFLGGIIKKKEAEKPSDEYPPELPELGAEAPKYEPLMSSSEVDLIKEAVSPDETPKRVPPMRKMKFRREEPEEMEEEEPAHFEAEPMAGKPIFVKIDSYREAMETIKELKIKMKEAGDIIAELKRIKDDEDKELQAWHEELESIKSKLLLVDKKLFEV